MADEIPEKNADMEYEEAEDSHSDGSSDESMSESTECEAEETLDSKQLSF